MLSSTIQANDRPVAGASPPKNVLVFVHLGYGYAADQHLALYQAGKVPDLVPYGFHHAAEMGCDVRYSHDAPEGFITALARRALGRVLGFDLVHAYRNREALFSADIVWTMEERQFLAVLALPAIMHSLPRPRLIAQSVWLFNNWHRFSFVKRWMFRRLLQRADVLTVHSANYLAPACEIVSAARVRLLPFGISLDSFPFREGLGGGVHSPIRILSMGSDRTRDWATLLAAFGNDERFEIIVVSRQLPATTVERIHNLKLPRQADAEEFRELYRWADYTVIPMVKNLYSGITVALEATSMGVPVVSARTGGVPTYFNEEEVLYVEPEDPVALREAVLACGEDDRHARLNRAQTRFCREDYSTYGMAKRYVELTKEMLGDLVAIRLGRRKSSVCD